MSVSTTTDNHSSDSLLSVFQNEQGQLGWQRTSEAGSATDKSDNRVTNLQAGWGSGMEGGYGSGMQGGWGSGMQSGWGSVELCGWGPLSDCDWAATTSSSVAWYVPGQASIFKRWLSGWVLKQFMESSRIWGRRVSWQPDHDRQDMQVVGYLA